MFAQSWKTRVVPSSRRTNGGMRKREIYIYIGEREGLGKDLDSRKRENLIQSLSRLVCISVVRTKIAQSGILIVYWCGGSVYKEKYWAHAILCSCGVMMCIFCKKKKV